MFGIYGVNGPVFHGSLEELPAVRPVIRRRPVEAIGTAGNELGEVSDTGLTTRAAAGTAAYRRMLHVDEERGPIVQAQQLMQPEVITVRASDDVVRAWRILTGQRIHQAPVLDDNRQLVGIVSERNLLTALNLDGEMIRDALARMVADVMTSPVVAAEPQTDIRRIARVMLEQDVEGVPIVSDRQRLIGFISRGDMLRAMVADPPLSLWR